MRLSIGFKLLFLAATIPSGLWATTYYVDVVKGDDNNTGTSMDQPIKTIDRVYGIVFQPGDDLLFKGGQTFTGGLQLNPQMSRATSQAPLKISSYGTGRAIIKSGAQPGLFANNAAGAVIKNLNFVGSGTSSENNGLWFYNNSGKSLSTIRVEDVDITGYAVGLFIFAEAGSEFKDIRVKNIVSHDNLASGIEMYGMGWGKYPKEKVGLTHVYIGYAQTYNNNGTHEPRSEKVNNTSGSGIYINGVENATIEHNVAHDNGGGVPATPGWEGNPLAIWAYGKDMTIQHNEAYRQRVHPTNLSDGGGFNFQGRHVLVQYNYSHDNDGIGYEFDGCNGDRYGTPYPSNSDFTVRYNISENDSQKVREGVMYFSGCIKNYQIYNNTIFASRSDFRDRPLVYMDDTIEGAYESPGFNNVLFFNNIFVTKGTPLIQAKDPSHMSVYFENNAFYDISGQYAIQWGEESETMEKWLSTTGQGWTKGSKLGDPMLVSPGQGGTVFPKPLRSLQTYRLKSGSPLIGAGLNLHDLHGIDVGRQDFYGNKLPLAPGRFNIGASEIAEP